MTKSLFYSESLVEQLNNKWKVHYIESGHSFYPQLEIEEARKYIKIWQFNAGTSGRSIWMFVDKENGFCYKPASTKAPAKGVRFGIDHLVNHPEHCDPYGSFLYIR